MSKTIKSLLCIGLLAGASLSASAYSLVSPTVGEVTTVKSLGTISLVWDSEVMELPTEAITLYDSSNQKVATGTADFDWDNYSAYTVTFSPTITAAGTYTAVVPANMASDNNNPEYRLTYKIEAFAGEAATPTAFDPENGASIVQSAATPFSTIRIEFKNDPSLTVNEANISLTNAKGDLIPFTIGGFYRADDPMLQYQDYPFVTINFNDEGELPSGTYTLTMKPGSFTSPYGSMMKEVVVSYAYTKTKAEADPTPLEIQNPLLGQAKRVGTIDSPAYEWIAQDAISFKNGMEIAQFVGFNENDDNIGSAINFSLNHGEKSNYVVYSLVQVEDNEILSSSQCIKLEDGSFLIPFPRTLNFIKEQTYRIDINAYSNVEDKVEFGQGASLTFKGTADAFQYSSASFVTVVPSSESTIRNREDNKITMLFTLPVKATAAYSIGFGAGTEAITCESSTGEEYDNVWYTYIPESVMDVYPDINVSVKAYGQDGRIVKGNNGGEGENALNAFNYKLTFCQPRIILKQTNSNVEAINTFAAYSSKGNAINPSWLASPYVINAKGETVAKLNEEYYYDASLEMKTPYKPLVWSSTAADADPLEIEFQMTPAITAKGKYTLVFPDYTFNFGTQYDGENSVAQSMDFYVVDFLPVSYSVDNCTVAMPSVQFEGNVELAVTPAEGWKLESLMLNDKDVTKEVVNGRYVSSNVTVAQNFYATFAFDGVTAEPASADEIVTDLKLRGWSSEGSLYVAGLKDGQTINVFTVGGNLMETVKVSSDTMKLNVPAGIYVVTVTEGNKTVALKLVNK